MKQQKIFDDQKFYNDREVAKILSVGRTTIWYWVKEGIISPGIRLGERVTRWPGYALNDFVKKQAEGQKEEKR